MWTWWYDVGEGLVVSVHTWNTCLFGQSLLTTWVQFFLQFDFRVCDILEKMVNVYVWKHITVGLISLNKHRPIADWPSFFIDFENQPSMSEGIYRNGVFLCWENFISGCGSWIEGHWSRVVGVEGGVCRYPTQGILPGELPCTVWPKHEKWWHLWLQWLSFPQTNST